MAFTSRSQDQQRSCAMKESANKLQFAIMCRVSTPGQTDGVSLEVQEDRGREYVKRAGSAVVAVYVFQESGRKDLEDRVQFQRVLSDGASGKWNAIWTLDQTRLARNVDGTAKLINFLLERHLEWHTPMGKMPIDTPSGKAMVQMFSVFSEHDTDNSSWKTLESREKLLARGKHAFGRWPWGRHWNKQTERWEIDLAQKQQIHRAYELYVREGKSLEATAKAVGMKKSTLWKAFRSASISLWERKLTTPEGVKTFFLEIPQLLNSRQALAVRRTAERNSTVMPDQARGRSLLQGMIRCWHCGGTMSRMPSRKGDGLVCFVYRHLPSSRTVRCLWHVPAELIEKAIVRACCDVINKNGELVTAIRGALVRTASGAAEVQTELAELNATLPTALKKLDRAVAALADFTEVGP